MGTLWKWIKRWSDLYLYMLWREHFKFKNFQPLITLSVIWQKKENILHYTLIIGYIKCECLLMIHSFFSTGALLQFFVGKFCLIRTKCVHVCVCMWGSVRHQRVAHWTNKSEILWSKTLLFSGYTPRGLGLHAGIPTSAPWGPPCTAGGDNFPGVPSGRKSLEGEWKSGQEWRGMQRRLGRKGKEGVSDATELFKVLATLAGWQNEVWIAGWGLGWWREWKEQPCRLLHYFITKRAHKTHKWNVCI